MAQRLYHFTHAIHALDDIRRRRLKIAEFHDLNDPFELLCVERRTKEEELAFTLYKADMSLRFGILSFSEQWKSILQWSNYADHHRGICLGFDVTNFAQKFGPVEYKGGKLPFPGKDNLNQAFSWKMLRTKYKGWQYEKEWRVFIELKDREWYDSASRFMYFADFADELVLREIILGVENKNTLDQVRDALNGYSNPVDVFKTRLSPDRFELLREHILSASATPCQIATDSSPPNVNED